MRFYSVTSPDDCLALGNPAHHNQISLLEPAKGWPTSMIDLIKDFDFYRERLDALIEATGQWKELDDCSLDAPIRECEKLICVGKNYADHAREMGGEAPEIPVIFSKFASALNRPGGTIELPTISDQVDFEAELVVVIGKAGRNIAIEQAMDHVFGYCCGNDVSARDWQKGKPGGQWLLGKTFDSFAPLGPSVVTADSINDPHELKIELRLNGETMQSASTAMLIFRIDFLISHVSKFVTLQPGDLLFTGTPAGVGAGRDPKVFLKAGDQVEVEIESLGVLANRVNLNAS